MEAQRGAVSYLLNRESLRRLMQINQGSQTFLRNTMERAFERGVAFASRGAKDVSHQAVRMHAHQYRLAAVLDISAHQRHVRLASIHFTRLRDEPEFSEPCLDQRFAHAVYVSLVR